MLYTRSLKINDIRLTDLFSVLLNLFFFFKHRTAEILYSFARQSVGRIQSVAQLIPLIANLYQNLTTVRRNLGLFQHHDAIPGTARPEVMLDYSER